ncbi:MAG: GNAT family N-acetyltransferase [Legionella sp.]
MRAEKCAPLITLEELNAAYEKNDILMWLLVEGEIAGYMWRELRPGYFFGAGAAIKEKFYGHGLSDYIIKFMEDNAKEIGLTVCKLTVIPENGRVIRAYMRHGFQMTQYVFAYSNPNSPGLFRGIMEKNLEQNNLKRYLED